MLEGKGSWSKVEDMFWENMPLVQEPACSNDSSHYSLVASAKGSSQERDSDAPVAPFVRVTVFLLMQHMAVFLQRPINPGGKGLMTAPF